MKYRVTFVDPLGIGATWIILEELERVYELLDSATTLGLMLPGFKFVIERANDEQCDKTG